MISAHDVLNKHAPNGRYLFKSPLEGQVCYQLSGHDAQTLANAAQYLESLGADLIDLNCGCPKPKIRKKGAGSALLENPYQLQHIIETTKIAINIPLTVKIRIQSPKLDIEIAKMIEAAGADALIVHGRRWVDDYDVRVNDEAIYSIKHAINIPVIANGDVNSRPSLEQRVLATGCDGIMISRAGCGNPHLYQQLLNPDVPSLSLTQRINSFAEHLWELKNLENEYSALLQSRSLLKYYFRTEFSPSVLSKLYTIDHIDKLINHLLHDMMKT